MSCTQCINTKKEEKNKKEKWMQNKMKKPRGKMADVRVMNGKMSYYWIDTIMI